MEADGPRKPSSASTETQGASPPAATTAGSHAQGQYASEVNGVAIGSQQSPVKPAMKARMAPSSQGDYSDALSRRVANLGLEPASSRASASVSPAATRLVKSQSAELAGILKSVRAAGPEKYVKREHYAWYVWPTTKEGMSDPRQTAIKSKADLKHVLAAPTVGVWADMLDALAEVLSTRRSRKPIPSIDHGRIEYFLQEWSSEAYRKEARETAPTLAAAVERFATAWKAAAH